MSESWTVHAEVYDAMIARAEADYPEETCGLIFELGEELELVPMRNLQNEMHARDPERFDRDAKTAYFFDPLEFQKVLQEKDGQGKALRSIYHSHPDHDAYFSKKDREDAVPPDWGEPLYPGTIYVVVSVKEGKAADVKGFLWSEDARDFSELDVHRSS